jgi:two-component system response regulator MprA
MRKAILIVEDEEDLREAMADYLAGNGYRVLTAPDGQQGLQQALSEHPDLILLDLMMPVMDGHQMLEKLRLDRWGMSAKVIIMSAMDDVQNIAGAYEGGITEYIIKGESSLEELGKRVREIVFANDEG